MNDVNLMACLYLFVFLLAIWVAHRLMAWLKPKTKEEIKITNEVIFDKDLILKAMDILEENNKTMARIAWQYRNIAWLMAHEKYLAGNLNEEVFDAIDKKETGHEAKTLKD